MRSSIQSLFGLGLIIGLGASLSACGDKKGADATESSAKHEGERAEKKERTKKTAEPATTATAATTVASVAPEPAPVATDSPSAVGAPAAGANAPSSDGSDVTQYDDQVVQSGTVYTKKEFSIYKSADATTPECGRVAAHTLINLKGSHSNWLLVEWPSGPATLSLGWIQEAPHGADLLATKDGLNPKFKHADWRLKAKTKKDDHH